MSACEFLRHRRYDCVANYAQSYMDMMDGLMDREIFRALALMAGLMASGSDPGCVWMCGPNPCMYLHHNYHYCYCHHKISHSRLQMRVELVVGIATELHTVFHQMSTNSTLMNYVQKHEDAFRCILL